MNTAELIDYSTLALAAYGQYSFGPLQPAIADLTILNGDIHGFAEPQAAGFSERFLVPFPTFNDGGQTDSSFHTSFDVSVFVGRQSENLGQVYLSFRGTAQIDPTDGANDLSALAELATVGAAASQIVAMYNWWQRVSTPVSTASPAQVPQYAFSFLTGQVTRIADAPSTGELAAWLGQQGGRVSVTGSSLGGHLAMAFAGLFPEVVDRAVAFNAPGFQPTPGVSALFSALGGRVPAPGNSTIVNVVSSETGSAGTQVDVIAGFPLGNFPGQQLSVPIENQFLTDVPDPKSHSYNHDQRQVTDSLAVFNLLQKLDPSLTLERYGPLLRSAAQGENRSLENLVDAVQSFLGIDPARLPADNAQRDALHAAIQSVSGGAATPADARYLALAGQLRILPADTQLAALAREHFGALVALQELSPLALVARDAADASARQALDTLWQTTRGADYAAWQADRNATAGAEAGFTRQWLDDRALLLQVIDRRNALPDAPSIVADSRHALDRVVELAYADPFDHALTTLLAWNPAGNAQGNALSVRPRQRIAFGDDGANQLEGTSNLLGDHLYGGGGNDTLTGLSGNDHLEGGTGDDQYLFADAFGIDTLSDADGRGSILFDGQVLVGGHGSGSPNVWLGADATGRVTRYVVRDSRESSTGKQLVMARAGDPTNTVTVNHFDLAAATSSAGYLGIRLDDSQALVLAPASASGAGPSTSSSPFAAWNFDPGSFTGLSTMAEGGAAIYTMFLRAAAQAGDTLTLVLSGLQDKFQAWIGHGTVAASGAVLALQAGQTQVSFTLLQQGELPAGAAVALSARFTSTDGEVAASNPWTLQLQDGGAIGQTLVGDQQYQLRTSAEALLREGVVVVPAGGQAFRGDGQGNLAPGSGLDVVDNVLFGGDATDRLQGLSGNDALDGGAGNDELQGGEGDDLIAGGAGQNQLEGGAGNDFLLAAGSLARQLQQLGPADRWLPPAGQPVLGRGATWGVVDQGDGLSVWHGALGAGDGLDSNRIDAGAGDDHAIAGAGNDYVLGGAGQDHLDGMGGSDIITGDDGADTIRADGIVLAGYLNSSLPAQHGADHVDAGAGNDTVEGGGAGDLLYGGSGDDQLFGDTSGPADGPFFVPLGVHGADSLHGDEGNDYLEGGGGSDLLHGDAGADMVWGDTAAVNVAMLAPDFAATAWGDDVLDGGAGDDTLIGGGRNDTLLGGAGLDALRGDESSAGLPGQVHGADLLDGEGGDDLLVGGGHRDTLLGGEGDDDLRGDDVLQVLAGEWHGDDYLDGGAGADRLLGGGGADRLYGGDGPDVLRGDLGGADAADSRFDGPDHLDGESGDDQLWGGGADDTLLGGTGNDQLDGGAGMDQMEGGPGDDRYVVDNALDQVFERQGQGTDTVTSTVVMALPEHVEHLVLLGLAALDASGNDAPNRLEGNAGANSLQGLAGNDTMDGGAGADTLAGGPGDDQFEVDHLSDLVVEQAGEGIDTVRTRVHYQLPEEVEHLVAAGTDPLSLGGNRLDNQLVGNAGPNQLRGGAGNDFLSGGGGDDVYSFARGDGRDTIDNTDLLRDTADAALPGARDILQFGAGIRASELLASRSGDALLLQLQDSADAVVIAGYFAADTSSGSRVLDHRIDQVAFEADPAWDGARITQEVARAAGNRAPALVQALPVLQARIGESLAYTVATGTIVDPDAGDGVRYSLRTATGGALPPWLVFDPATRTLTALPGAGDAGSLQLELRGTDRYGLAVAAGLMLRVSDPVQRGTPGNDTLAASALGDTLVGGAGHDSLLGGALGDTYLFALGDGRDTISETAAGGSGIDSLVFGPGIAPADITARREGESLVLAHRNGTDAVTVLAWFTTGRPWVEQIRFADDAVWTADVLTENALVVAGGADDDRLAGTALNDHLLGLAGNDMLEGGSGSDTLDGGEGHDVLVAGAGATGTLLLGGAGNDRLRALPSARGTVFDGGRGDDAAEGSDEGDTYRFGLGDGQDRITEPSTSTQATAQDVLQFGVGIAPADLRVERYANDLLFTHANGTDQVTVGDWFTSTVNFSATARRIETIRFADGSSWIAADLTAAALVVRGTEATDFLTSSDMDDTLFGMGGNDRLSGGRGNNVLDGGDGDDLLLADDGRFQVVSFAGVIPVIRDYWGSNVLRGGAGNDTLFAAALARDTVHEGGPGNDSMTGSAYNDTYRFNLGDGRDTITEAAPAAGMVDVLRFGPGILPSDIRVARLDGHLQLLHANGRDQVTVTDWFTDPGRRLETIVFDNGVMWNEAAVQDALPVLQVGSAAADVLRGTAAIDDLQGLGGDDVLSGAAGADSLQGGPGNDRLDGGTGADTLVGGAGDDTYAVDQAGDLIQELPGGGTDTVESPISFVLPAELERLVLVGLAPIQGTGNTLPNLLVGNAGANTLSGAAGDDTLQGGAGNDLYLVDNTGDRIIESPAAGQDIVRSTVSYVLALNLEELELSGASAFAATGNAANNTLRGTAWANLLDGAGGADTMAGGAGDDTYRVDHGGDQVLELPGGGQDSVESSVSWVLGPQVEHLTLAGEAGINGMGNELANRLQGNAAANTLYGWGGHDSLYGGAGSDRLMGGDGNDALWGDAPGEKAEPERIASLVVHARGTACDGVWPTMEVWLSGVKVQTFSVESASWVPYRVTEATGMFARAVDIVFTNDAVRADLGQDRNLYIDRIDVNSRSIRASGAGSVLDFGEGMAALDGSDTTLGNGMVPTHGALRIGLGSGDWLDGGAGADTLVGGAGADVYLVDHGADRVVEVEDGGHDIVLATTTYTLPENLEDLELVSNTAIDGTGNAQANTLRGNAFANRLDGQAGDDLLVGGAGGDTYVFGRGSGRDAVLDVDATPGNTDAVRFGTDIFASQLWFRQDGQDLEVAVLGTDDRLTIQGWYSSDAHHVEQFHEGSGRILLDSQVHHLVNAMAAFAPPPLGVTGYGSPVGPYHDAIAPVLAAYWQ